MKKLIALPDPTPPIDRPVIKRRHPDAVEHLRPHKWAGQAGGRRTQPAWLEELNNGGQTCTVCGVTLVKNFVLADHLDEPGAPGDRSKRVQFYTYMDAKNHTFTSKKPLGCPTFILDHMGTTMENREMIRETDDRVDHTEDRIDTVEERLERLENDNIALRARLEERIDVTAVVEWLSELVMIAAQNKMGLVNVQIEGGRTAALPEPVANLILDIGLDQEIELVNRTNPASADDRPALKARKSPYPSSS